MICLYPGISGALPRPSPSRCKRALDAPEAHRGPRSGRSPAAGAFQERVVRAKTHRTDQHRTNGARTPAFERVRELKDGWVGTMRPSRQPRCGFLRATRKLKRRRGAKFTTCRAMRRPAAASPLSPDRKNRLNSLGHSLARGAACRNSPSSPKTVAIDERCYDGNLAQQNWDAEKIGLFCCVN